MIKDAYSLPHIDETLYCLGGAIIFTSLDLKSGYWQVEINEESKALTAFTVGPLGFYECVQSTNYAKIFLIIIKSAEMLFFRIFVRVLRSSDSFQ